MDTLRDTAEWLALENPWPGIAFLAVAWGAVWAVGQVRPSAWTARLTGLLPMLAGAWLLLAYAVDTDRETVGRELEALMAAAEKRDAATVRDYFALPAKRPANGDWSQADVLARTNQVTHLQRVNLHTPEVSTLPASSADGGGSAIRTVFTAGIYGSGWGPVVIGAELDWRSVGGRWRVVAVRSVKWRVGVDNWVTVR